MERVLYTRHYTFRMFYRGKSLELRSATRKNLAVSVGDVLVIRDSKNELRKKVLAIRRYGTVVELLREEDCDKIAPGYAKDKVQRGLEMLFVRLEDILVFELGDFDVPKPTG